MIYSGLEKRGTRQEEWHGLFLFDPSSIISSEVTIKRAEVELAGGENDQHLHKDNKDLPGSWSLKLLRLPKETQAKIMETDELDPPTLWALVWAQGEEAGSLSLDEVGPGMINTFRVPDELLPVLQETLEKKEKIFFRLDYQGSPHLKRVFGWKNPVLKIR